MFLTAPNILCKHGFSTRDGGFSAAPFASLNLGGSDDDLSIISKNRNKALEYFGYSKNQHCFLKQVHGNKVVLAQPGQQEGDAIITNIPGLAITVSAADCYPILFFDGKNNIIGAAHAGWRGTVSRIASNTINEMINLGAELNQIKVAIGQGISCDKFEVGNEVIDKFMKEKFPESIILNNKIDLLEANKFVLDEVGILKENIWSLNRCTFEKDFFSYRRDKGVTGRMWGLIGL
ncbi:MAG: peptidoglycan editing factor PgeF [Bacteroidia bacterium]